MGILLGITNREFSLEKNESEILSHGACPENNEVSDDKHYTCQYQQARISQTEFDIKTKKFQRLCLDGHYHIYHGLSDPKINETCQL